MCAPCKVSEKSMPQNATNNVYHGLPNGTPFAAQEDNRGTSYHPDPVIILRSEVSQCGSCNVAKSSPFKQLR